MNGFRRLCCFVFGLAGILALAALALPWVGPWQQEAASLIGVGWYFQTLAVLVCVTALGLVIELFRGLFSRKAKNVVIDKLDGGTITVTRDAIASQASHIVAADGTCTAERVRVNVKRNRVRVFVRVLPRETVDVVSVGPELHDELMRGLAAVCGDTIADVSLEFVEPETVTAVERPDETDDNAASGSVVSSAAPAEEATASSEIRLPMGTGTYVSHDDQPQVDTDAANAGASDSAPADSTDEEE